MRIPLVTTCMYDNMNWFSLEMGRMSVYDIRPKRKVWAGSLNECRTFVRMLYARTNKIFYR